MTAQSFLKSAIAAGTLFELSAAEYIQLVAKEYPVELGYLKSAYATPSPVPPKAAAVTTKTTTTLSPSAQLFGTEFVEVNRTLVSILALRWLYHDDYASFTNNQPVENKLSRASFEWIRSFILNGIRTNEDLYTLITVVIINDLGKSSTLVAEGQRSTKSNNNDNDLHLSDTNHDMVLYRVVCHKPELIPCLAWLSTDHRKDAILGIALGAEFNFGQFAQAESSPVCLSALKKMKECMRAFEMRFMEQLLDIAGAAGHVDHTGCQKLIEPIFQSYRIVYELVHDVVSEKTSITDAYDANLARKTQLLIERGWNAGEKLDVKDPEHRALMRLLNISNATSADSADLVQRAFYDFLTEETRSSLIQGLNVVGSVEQVAVQPTYIPAMCTLALTTTHSDSRVEKARALAAVFRYLARTLTVGIQSSLSMLPPGVIVLERDVRGAIQQMSNSSKFQEDPDMLDHVDLPTDQVAMMADDIE